MALDCIMAVCLSAIYSLQAHASRGLGMDMLCQPMLSIG
jgi:hypothetical protein